MTEDMIGMDDMAQIFEVTDTLEIDREMIRVELTKEDPGSVVKRSDGMIEIVVPLTTPLESWLPTLKSGLEELGYGEAR